MDRASQPIDDSRVKLRAVCGVVTSRAGSRCTDHARQSNRSRHSALYSTRAWQRLSALVLRAWRGEHGNWCPGDQRQAHLASDLVGVRLTQAAYAHGLALALPEKVALARPTGVGGALITYDMPVEGRDEWLAAARRLA